MTTITLLHTNDLHSHFENWPRLSRWLLAQKRAAAAENRPVYLLDDGDAMDRVHPLTEATDGKVNVSMLNDLGYTAATIGNNEGIGNDHQVLEHLYDQAKFQVALANLFEEDGTRPAFARPVVRQTAADGTRIAIIGLTAPYFLTYAPNHWQVKPANAVLPELLAEIGGTYDVLVVLSHLGLPMDRYLAEHYPQIDVIVGGHTHHLLPQGERVNQTLLVAAGKYGQAGGRVDLTVDANHRVIDASAQTVITADLPELSEDAAQIDAWQQQGQAQLAAGPVAWLPEAVTTDYRTCSPLLELGLDAVARAGGTEAALLNAGLFLTPLPAGLVTKATLHACLPHPMHLLRVTLPGRELWRLMMEVEKNRPFLRGFHMVGMSFRGDRFGEVAAKHITVTAKKQVLFGGAPLTIDQDYTITTVDHYLFVPFFPTIEIMGDNQFLFPGFLRDAVGDYLAAQYPLTNMVY